MTLSRAYVKVLDLLHGNETTGDLRVENLFTVCHQVQACVSRYVLLYITEDTQYCNDYMMNTCTI